MSELTAQEKADALEQALAGAQEALGADCSISIMAHDVGGLALLDDSWEIDALRSGGKIYPTAKKNGITIFGKAAE